MSTHVSTPESRQSTDPWRRRVESGDWEAITAEVNEYGGALLPQLLTDAETARIGVSAIRSGRRHTLALVFHDAA